MSRLILIISVAWATFGCTDSRGNLDDFAARVIDASNVSAPDAEVLAEIPDVTGDFLFVLDPSPVPGMLIRFRATSVLERGATPTDTTLALSLQPLDKDTLEPVGDPLVTNPAKLAVSATGEFSGQLAGSIEGPANAISGTPLTFDTQLGGIIRNIDLLCGTIDGAVTAPLVTSLDGSTFGMVRIPDGANLSDVEPVGACPDPAEDIDAGVSDAGVDAGLDAGIDAS